MRIRPERGPVHAAVAVVLRGDIASAVIVRILPDLAAVRCHRTLERRHAARLVDRVADHLQDKGIGFIGWIFGSEANPKLGRTHVAHLSARRRRDVRANSNAILRARCRVHTPWIAEGVALLVVLMLVPTVMVTAVATVTIGGQLKR